MDQDDISSISPITPLSIPGFVQEEELKEMKMAESDKKIREMAYISQFLTQDCGFTDKDLEQVHEEECLERASKVSRSVNYAAVTMTKKVNHVIAELKERDEQFV